MSAPSTEEIPSTEPLVRYRLAVVAAGVLWSLGGLFIKWLTLNPVWEASALGITCHRSLFAALCLAPLLPGRKRPSAADAAVSTTLYTVLLALYVSSTQGTSAANAIFLQYTAPVFALALGTRFFGEPSRSEDRSALAVAMLGIAVLFFGSFKGGEQLPLVMGLGSGVLFGIFSLWLRRMRHADPVSVTAINNAGVALLSGFFLLLTRPGELLLIPRALGGERELLPVAIVLMLMGSIQIAAPYVLFSYGLRRIPAVEASLLSLIEPLLNPIWVALVVGEKPAASTLAGGVLILLALGGRYLRRAPRSSG